MGDFFIFLFFAMFVFPKFFFHLKTGKTFFFFFFHFPNSLPAPWGFCSSDVIGEDGDLLPPPKHSALTCSSSFSRDASAAMKPQPGDVPRVHTDTHSLESR